MGQVNQGDVSHLPISDLLADPDFATRARNRIHPANKAVIDRARRLRVGHVQESQGVEVLGLHLGAGLPWDRKMRMKIAADVALLPQVDPAAQPERPPDLRPARIGSDGEGQRTGFEPSPDFDQNAAVRQEQTERPIHIAPPLIEILDMGVLTRKLDGFAVGISERNPGRQRLAGRVVHDAPLHPGRSDGKLDGQAKDGPEAGCGKRNSIQNIDAMTVCLSYGLFTSGHSVKHTLGARVAMTQGDAVNRRGLHRERHMRSGDSGSSRACEVVNQVGNGR